MKAIIGTDGSDCAQVALDLVGSLAWPDGSTLHVVSALDQAAVYGPFMGFAPEVGNLESDLEIALEQQVAESAAQLQKPGLLTAARVAMGRASTVVCDLAGEVGADLIVVGSRGHGRIASMLLGSASAEIVDHAHRPVLVARGRAVKKIVFATDGSENSLAAERLIETWPIFRGTEIDVVSVAQHARDWDGLMALDAAVPADWWSGISLESRQEHQRFAADAARRLVEAGHPAVIVTPAGEPANEIVRMAEERGADLIVLGSRGNTGLRRLLLGSVARNVLLHAPCSVLVVPLVRTQ